MSSEKDFFNAMADSWDDMEVRSLPARVRYILSRCGIGPGTRVLDLGTGTGVLIPYIKERIGSHGLITALDFSPRMLEKAREKYEGKIDDLEFICSDFENEAVIGRFDHIMMYCVYPHLHRPFDTLQRLISDNLVPGGKLSIAFPSDEKFINSIHNEKKSEADMLPPAPELVQRLTEAGFIAELTDATPDSYIVSLYAPK